MLGYAEAVAVILFLQSSFLAFGLAGCAFRHGDFEQYRWRAALRASTINNSVHCQ
jgi:hypothetical protein